MAERQYSIVEYFAEHEGYRCGYCKSPDTNYSHGMWAHSMTVQDYQDLMDRGWRRSGKYCYKPTMNVTCCPQYTIRCDATQFKLSKSQKTVLKRVNRYLNTGHVKQEGGNGNEKEANSKHADDPQENCGNMMWKEANIAEAKATLRNCPTGVNVKQIEVVSVADPSSSEQENVAQVENSVNTGIMEVSENTDTNKKTAMPRAGVGPDPLKPPCKKAKLLRKERREQKLLKQQCQLASGKAPPKVQDIVNHISPVNQGKTLEEFLADVQEMPAHRLEIRLIKSKPAGKDFLKTFGEEYAVYRKYQQVIHNDPPEKCTEKQYSRFLVDSPVEHYSPPNGPESGYGSFHQQYWLDGKLIAVGVIDILPHSVSSVYFYYDPEYSFLSLGTYASLREIAFTLQLQRRVQHLKYYYMGFYIHSCIKMRYKGQFSPSFLLCPETYTWQPIEFCRQKLDETKYSRMEQDPNKGDQHNAESIQDVLTLHKHEAMTYKAYRDLKPKANDEAEVLQYAKMIGVKCAKRMLLFRS